MFSKVAGFVRINEKLWPRLPLHVVLWGKRIQNAKNFQYIISCSMSKNFETTVGVLYTYQNNIHLHWIIHSSNMFLKQIYFFLQTYFFESRLTESSLPFSWPDTVSESGHLLTAWMITIPSHSLNIRHYEKFYNKTRY